ncbi:MAG: large-conductance mechanosensitive channel protein MscL [Fimbriimonadaceae bacterium]|nr:large-conductance mechanosensitive channel protein MscL [Chitinophagales bacterium]
MGMMKEFKDFAMKGSLIDIAVGFVMGVAFAKVTSAFIDGIVMPIVGMIQGKDMSQWVVTLKKGYVDATGNIIPAVTIKYGTFISVAIEFIIVAFVMFMVIKAINTMKRKEAGVPAAPLPPTKEEVLLTEIRDLLKK